MSDNPFWRSRKVLVTGGAGFLGSFVVEQLKAQGCEKIIIPRSHSTDLRDATVVDRMLSVEKPDLIIHLAAACGGIGINQLEPGRFFYDNAIMGIQLMEYARRHKVQKFVQVGSVCAYPKDTPVPFREEDLWNGYPEETNAPYGLAKKMLLVQAQAYRAQFGINAIYLMPANLYGPRDHVDLQTSHVIPAMLRKFVEAKIAGSPQVVLWGTGKASRDFFYVEDAAKGIVLAAEKYNEAEPVNLGSGVETRILELAQMVQQITGYRGEIVWDHSKPDGQPRRALDTQRAVKAFGFRAPTSLRDGLLATLEWYQAAAVR